MTRSLPGDALAAITGCDQPLALTETVRSACDVLAMASRAADPTEAMGWWTSLVTEAVAAAARVVPAPAGVRWQWYITGSCGRAEGLPGADVETLIQYDADPDVPEMAILNAAAQVHDLLEAAGIAPDANGAIGSRARCCRTRTGWAQAIGGWAAEPAVDRGVVMAGLVLDASAVGDWDHDAVDLSGEMLAAAVREPALRRAMSQDCEAVRAVVPARLAVLTRRRDTVDVKRAVIDPIVRLARLKAALGGTAERSTRARLDAADGVLPEIDWAALRRALDSTTAIRWALRRDSWVAGRHNDVIGMTELAPHERAAVRSAGREVLGAQRVLRYVAASEVGR